MENGLRMVWQKWRVCGVLLLCALCACGAHAATLKQIKTYPEQDKLDILLLLDSAFSGDVGTANIQSEKMTMVSKVSSASKWSKSFDISPIKKLEIIPKNNNLYFKVESRKRYYVKPSISKDKNTLRLSFFTADSGIVDSLLKSPTTLKPAPIDQVLGQSAESSSRSSAKSANTQAASTQSRAQAQNLASPESTNTEATNAESSPSQTLRDSGFSWDFRQNLSAQSMDMQGYWYYIAGFVAILALLLYLRKRVRGAAGLNNSLKIISQNQIDPKNKVIIIETKEYFYMVLLGEKSNLLLDKIPRNALNSGRLDSSSVHSRALDSAESSAHAKSKPASKAFNDEFWNTLKNAK